MRGRFPWWIVFLGIGLALAAGGAGYVVVTARKNGPRWNNLLPAARAKIEELERAAETQGLAVMFYDGWRSPEDQKKLMANPAGVTKVTDPLDSHHVWGVAFDIVFRNAVGIPYWPADNDPRWRQLALLGRSLGLRSGGLEWGWDFPHIRLPGFEVAALKRDFNRQPLAFLQSRGVAVA